MVTGNIGKPRVLHHSRLASAIRPVGGGLGVAGDLAELGAHRHRLGLDGARHGLAAIPDLGHELGGGARDLAAGVIHRIGHGGFDAVDQARGHVAGADRGDALLRYRQRRAYAAGAIGLGGFSGSTTAKCHSKRLPACWADQARQNAASTSLSPGTSVTGRPTGLAATGTGFIMSGIQAIIGV